MEAVLKRAGQRAKQADKTLAKRLKLLKNSQEWEIRRQRERTKQYEASLYIDERARRRDRWERGPLARRHDVGSEGKFFGTFDAQFYGFTNEFDKRKPKWFHIVEGDRVVVLRGRDRGRIGEVLKLDEEKCAVRVRDMNKMELKVPELVRESIGGQDIVATEREISLKDVKLVYPLPDSETGVPKDVIIDDMEVVGRTYDVHKRKLKVGHRVIAGTSIVVPWPEKIEHEEQDRAADTPSDLVDVVTFRPQLLTAPMPLGLIDELRHKYSHFRTRHTYEYVQKLEARAAEKEQRKELINTMLTPVQEVALQRAKLKAEQQRELTRSQLAVIGEVMAQEQSRKQGSALQAETASASSTPASA